MKQKKFVCLGLILGFLLGCHNGYIALWKDGHSSPMRVFPYRVALLPTPDQQALRRGIVVADETELAHLLEDYLS